MAALLFPLLIFGALWYFMIRPQRARMRERELMVTRMAVGDEVVTVGGIHGTITELDDDTVLLEIAPAIVITVARRAVDHILDDESDDEDWDDEDEDDESDDEDWDDEEDEDGDDDGEDWDDDTEDE
jgi:preprotein translocase subunit YajC